MANGIFRGWNSSFLRGFGKLNLLYAYISEDSLFMVFNKKAVITGITGITGISLTSDVSTLSVVAVVSGSGTNTLELSLSRIVDSSEVITLDIAEINDITKYKGVSGLNVTQNTALPYILPFTLLT